MLEEYEQLEEIGHISEVEPTGIIIYAPVECIAIKYIYMNVNEKQYISHMPNEFENEWMCEIIPITWHYPLQREKKINFIRRKIRSAIIIKSTSVLW